MSFDVRVSFSFGEGVIDDPFAHWNTFDPVRVVNEGDQGLLGRGWKYSLVGFIFGYHI